MDCGLITCLTLSMLMVTLWDCAEASPTDHHSTPAVNQLDSVISTKVLNLTYLDERAAISVTGGEADLCHAAEICLCIWTVHVEADSWVEANFSLHFPERYRTEGCVSCHLRYGYINSDRARVVVDQRCDLNSFFMYTAKCSIWLEFFCTTTGPPPHRLHWPEANGFHVNYVIRKEEVKTSHSWALSTIFAFVVMVLSLITVTSIGCVIYRSCRAQPIQPIQRASRHHCSRCNERLRYSSATDLSTLPLRRADPDQSSEGDIALGSSPADDDDDGRFDHDIRPVQSNHTYISILNSNQSATNTGPLCSAGISSSRFWSEEGKQDHSALGKYRRCSGASSDGTDTSVVIRVVKREPSPNSGSSQPENLQHSDDVGRITQDRISGTSAETGAIPHIVVTQPSLRRNTSTPAHNTTDKAEDKAEDNADYNTQEDSHSTL